MNRIDEHEAGAQSAVGPHQGAEMQGIKAVHAHQGCMGQASSSLQDAVEGLADVTDRHALQHSDTTAVHPRQRRHDGRRSFRQSGNAGSAAAVARGSSGSPHAVGLHLVLPPQLCMQ